MQNGKWRVYNDLAWMEPIVEPPENFVEETNLFARWIKEYSRRPVHTLLHLGCGSGHNDFTFKEHFQVTGVDISQGMLEVARGINPEVEYLHGDMRDVDLGRRFDAVTVPDSIGYMVTETDLARAIDTASRHLAPGGVFLVVTHIHEEFRENNFVYGGARGDWHIIQFENNYMPDPQGTTYEATFLYIIRYHGAVQEILSETHLVGVFPLETWLDLFTRAGLEVEHFPLPDFYAPFIMGEGEYPLRAFVGTKPA